MDKKAKNEKRNAEQKDKKKKEVSQCITLTKSEIHLPNESYKERECILFIASVDFIDSQQRILFVI